MSKNKKILFKAILYKSFVYLLIFSHLLWSSSNVLASGELLVERPYYDDFHRSRFLHKTIQTEPFNVHHINLDKDANGDFHINFDHLSSSAIIDYRSAGTLIARVLVDQTNLILEGTSPHRLIIDSLIAREQLSCKSEGQIAFAKNIFVKSADIQSNGLHFMGNFTARDKSRISTGTMVANGTISSPYMRLTTKDNAQFLGDIDTQLLNFSIGGNLDIGSKELAIAVQATDGMNISSKKLSNFGHLITDLGKLSLKVDELQNTPNARIISDKKLDLMTREFFNEGVIQGKTTTHLKTKGFTNQGTINSEGDFQLDSSDFAENTGFITVIGTSKVTTNGFSNIGKLTFGKESRFETESFLYNTGEFIFANTLNLRAALVDNYGLMSVSNLFHLQGTNFKNFGKLQVEKSFGFSLQEDFFNDEKGHISIQGLASGTYKKLHNKGKWFAKGGFVSKGDHFINDRHATWQINNIWKNNSKNLTLGGHVSVEHLALLDVLENARLSGFLHVPALKISAQTSIECDPSTTLDVTHHLGFKATNFIDFDAQILSRSRASFEHSPFSKELAQYVSALPKGVFLTAGKHLRKAGKVVAEQGSVLMLSQGELKHVGFTESGFGEQDILQLNATAMLGVGGQLYSHNLLDIISDRSLEIESLASVRAENVRVHGKEDVNVRGRIQATKSITVNSERNLTFAELAKLDAEQNALLSAQENLNNRGKLRANGTLNLKSGWLLSNYGELSADSTTVRSKWVYNKAKIHADTQLDMGIDYGCLNLGQLDGRNTKINAGTFINLWDVNGQTSLKINSLANINANVLRGHNISTNSLINYNFGLYLPTTPASWSDLVGWDTAITLTRNLNPTIGGVIGMAKSGMGLYKQGESLLKKLKDIRKGFIPASISETIGLAADFKEFAVPVLQFTRETGLTSVAQNSYQAYQDGQFNNYISDGYKGSVFATSQALSSAFLTLSNTPQNLTSYYQTASSGFPEGNFDHCASTLCSEIGRFGYQAFKDTQQVFYEGYQGYQAGTFDAYLQTRYQGIQEYANNHGASFVMPRVSTSSLFNRNSGKIYSGAISEQSLYSYNEGTIGAFGRYDSTTLFDYTEVGSVYGDQIGITSRGSILTGAQSHIYSRNSTTLDAQESVTHHGHILAHQGTATVRAKKDLFSATASVIKGQTAIVRAGSQATIEGMVDGKEKVHVFGAESTTVASSGFVIGEKERQVGMDTYVTVGNDGLLKVETAYSRKTDIQGQIQDTSSLTVNQSDSRTIIGGHVVDVDNHVQSHGITSIEATDKLTIGKAAHVSGDKGAYANAKDITHDGSFQSNEGTASLRAVNDIKAAAHSSVAGKDGAHVHGKDVKHEGIVQSQEGVAIVTADKDLVTTTSSIIKGQLAIAKANSHALIEGIIDGKEKAQAFGMESTTLASSGSVIGEKERLVGMDSREMRDEEGQLLKDETDNPKRETIYSKKTDIQGQVKDTPLSSSDRTNSRTIIGGHVVDVNNHVQSHGITSIEATDKLTIGKAARVSGDLGVYANGKDITHDGSFQSNEGTASVRAVNGIKTAAHSLVEGKDGAHIHGKDVKHEGIVQSQEGIAIVTADKDLVTTTSSIIKGQLAIAKANGHALIEGIVDGKEKAQAFGMESTTLASSGSVIGEKERLVGMDSREMRDEEGQLLKDETDNPKRETIYSKKTDIQGQVKDTSPSSSDRTNSRTLVGGSIVNVNNQLQSHGITSIEATDKLTIGKTGKIIGDKGAYVNGKDVTHDGDIQSKDGTASISAADNLTTTAGSVTEGQVTVLKAGEKANIKGKFKGSIFLVEAKGDVDLDANLEEKRLVRIGGQNVSVRGSHSSKGIKKSKEDKEEIGLIYQAREKLTTDVTAVAEEDIVVSAKVVETRGNYSAKKISLIGEDYLDNYAKVRASEMLSVRSNWLFSNYGELSSDNTIVRSKWLYNEGTIQADTQLDMGIDYGCLNFGYLDSRNTKINAGAFINLWDVKGQSSLRVNSLVNINVGLMRGHSIATNSLVSLNLGLYLPTIPASWTDLFSWDTAVTIARNFNPCMGSVAGAAKTGYSLVRQGGQIVDKLKGMKSGAIAVSVSEIIGLVADGKEFATSGLQFTHETGLDTVAQNGYQALQDGTFGQYASDTYKSAESIASQFTQYTGLDNGYKAYQGGKFGQYVSDTYKSAESIVSSSAKRSLNSLTTYCDAATTVYQEGNFGQYALAPAQSMRDFGSQLISDGNQAYQAGKLDSYLQTTYQNAKSFANDNGASFIMPHVNTSSLFSYNGGKIYSGSVSEQSLYSYNHGVIEAFGRYDSTSLLGFTNAGSIYGDQIGIKSSGSIVTEAQSHIYSRKSATLHAEKSITHQGHLQSLQGTASVYGAERTLIGRESSAKGKQVYIGKTVQSSLAEDGTEVIEILHSKITETAEGAGLKGENIQIAGDKLSSAAKINARTVSFESKDGEILNPQDIQASEAYVALGHYNGGGQGALDLANKMLHVPTVVMDAHQEDFVNEETLKIHGDYRSFIFKTVDNSAPIDATGKLILDGIQNFRTTADINAATGLYTISSKGRHETLNGAVLATKQGITHVEGALGLTLQSVLLDDNTVKRAGYVGDRVERVTNGVFDNTAGQTVAGEIVSLIGGNQTDRALTCANNSTSLNADGSKSILQGGKRATQTYARTEDLSDYTSEKIKGALTTEAGIRRANKGGSTFVEGGIEAVTLHHTYEAEKGYKKSGLFNQHKEEWIREDTDFYVPEVHSSQGNFDFISSAESRLEAILYNVAKTSDVGGRGNAVFTASVVRNYYQGSESRWWGLGKKRYEGYEDCAQVAHLLGQEKINIISGREPALFESTIIDVAQGGGIYSPKGIMSQPVILEASFVERRQGIGLSCFANRSFESIHPVAHRIASLAEYKDGISGAVSDLGGLTTSLFNSTTHAAQTYNMKGSFLEYSLSEVGMGKISLGYNDTQINNHAKQSLPGFIYSGGELVIQTDSGYEADLSGMNTKIKTLCLDTDRLKLGGTLQTSHHQEKTYSAVLLFDILHPTVITVSADHRNSIIDGITHTQTHHEIDQLHLLHQNTEIDLQNADLTIGKSSGETYLININDQQDYTHTKGHHEGFSVSIDMITGLPIGGGVSAGYTDIHSYATPYRSKVRIGEGDNFQGIIETQLPDKIKGTELSVFYQQMNSSQDEALSMPLTVSGQVGNTRFRAEPIFVKRDALARDISTIQRAGQLVVENFNRQQTRDDLRERLLTECMSRGLLEKEASEISESIVAAYDQVHAAKDKNGFSQPRILDEEGPVFISKHGELSGEEAQKLRHMLQERQMQLSEEISSYKLEHDNFEQHIEELNTPTIRESEGVSVTQTLGEESEFDIERDKEIGSNITSKDPLTSIDVATLTLEKMVEDITTATVVEEQDWYGCIEDTSLRKFVGLIQEFGSEVGSIGEHAKEIVQSEHPIFGENSSWEGLSPLEKAFRIRMENEYKEDALTAMIFDAALKVSFDAVLKVGSTLSWPYRTFIAPTVESNTHALGNKIAKTLHQQAGISKSAAQDIGEGIEYSLNFASEYTVNLGIIKGINKVSQLNRTTTIAALDLAKTSPVCCEYTSCNNHLPLLEKKLIIEGQQAQLLKGKFDIIAGNGTTKSIRDAPRLAKQYGGNLSDWAKIKSYNEALSNGKTLELHAYMNVKTRKIIEIKPKVQ